MTDTTALARALMAVGIDGADGRDNITLAEYLMARGVVVTQVDAADTRLRPTADEFNARPVEQRLDRLALAHDQLYSDLATLAYVLAPVLPDGELAAEGDDQPEEPRPASPLAQRLQKETVQAEHIAAKVRAITKALDL